MCCTLCIVQKPLKSYSFHVKTTVFILSLVTYASKINSCGTPTGSTFHTVVTGHTVVTNPSTRPQSNDISEVQVCKYHIWILNNPHQARFYPLPFALPFLSHIVMQ